MRFLPRSPWSSAVLSLLAVAALAAPAASAPAPMDARDPLGSWPLRPAPPVAAGFDPPADPWGAGHRGVDLLGSPGARVRAALGGRVSFSGMLAGRGVVVVDHGGTRTTYEPVVGSTPVGTLVAEGDVIGHLALPGSHCVPRACLHWGWLRGETYLDPLGLVGAAPVRLLPLWREAPAVPFPAARVPTHPYAAWRPLWTGSDDP